MIGNPASGSVLALGCLHPSGFTGSETIATVVYTFCTTLNTITCVLTRSVVQSFWCWNK